MLIMNDVSQQYNTNCHQIIGEGSLMLTSYYSCVSEVFSIFVGEEILLGPQIYNNLALRHHNTLKRRENVQFSSLPEDTLEVQYPVKM